MLSIKTHLYTSFIIYWDIQSIALLAIVILMVCLLSFMLLYLLVKAGHEKKHAHWRTLSDTLIHKAVFDDEEKIDETFIKETLGEGNLKKNKYFRKILKEEIISAKKNITGAAAENLIYLYRLFDLDKYAIRKLNHLKWYVRAKAIHELTTMHIAELVDHLHLFTNDPNEFVRMEAQSALVQFNGFEGMSFLDTIAYPISDWQQIKLLQLLSLLPPSTIDTTLWFESENSSVVVFALKLARNYNRFEQHDAIAKCLDHSDAKVRLEAIICLNEIYTDETSDHLIGRFLKESLKHQLAMIRVMQTLGTERDILFLTDLLNHESDQLKLDAARALAHASNNGMAALEAYSEQSEQDITEIVMHIKREMSV